MISDPMYDDRGVVRPKEWPISQLATPLPMEMSPLVAKAFIRFKETLDRLLREKHQAEMAASKK